MPELKVITFDLDNTLWDVDRVIINAEQRMRTWLLAHVPAFHERFPPETIFELRTEIVNRQPHLKHDLSRLREEVLYQAISRCGYPEALAREYAHQAFQLFFEARHEVEFFEGALESLAILAKHYVLGALTNGNADFTKLKLDGYFSFGYSAASVGAGKPAPDMFHAALEHTGATSTPGRAAAGRPPGRRYPGRIPARHAHHLGQPERRGAAARDPEALGRGRKGARHSHGRIPHRRARPLIRIALSGRWPESPP